MTDRRSWTDVDLVNAVKTSTHKAEILEKLGLKKWPGNYETVNRHIWGLKLDISHLVHGNQFKRGHQPSNKIALEEILVKDSTYTNTTSLKKRLIKEAMLKNECAECGHGTKWNGKILVMILDHVNGIKNDNRIENLRLLCPNCNSQMPTFSGKNMRVRTKKKRKCSNCENSIKLRNKSGLCIICYRETLRKSRTENKARKGWTKECSVCGTKICDTAKTGKCLSCYGVSNRRVDRPKYEDLVQQIRDLGYCGTARLYGVSDNAIRKWERTMNK